jgi:hypothetical protein
MKLLTTTTSYPQTIEIAKQISILEYNNQVTFHCFWHGNLNEKHLYSAMSCYYFNVFKNKHKIILWLESNVPNEYNKKIEKYCEIKYFNLKDEIKNTFFENIPFGFNPALSFYSDVVRYILLYKYGGCWFDLDCFFLRSFDPLFHRFKNEICVYQWENQNYPNGAIYISLIPKSDKMKKIIKFIINRNNGWGFQEANLTYNLDLDLLVLPCSWFDGDWIENSYNIGTVNFFKDTDKSYNFTNFFEGAFCYHWHNKWNVPIGQNSIIVQLVNQIKSGFNLS